MKFGVPIEYRMPMAVKRSKSKPEVEFQYGGLGCGLSYLVEILYADSSGPC